MNSILCAKCENKGYIPAFIQPARAGDVPTQTAMFCTCSSGVNLRMLTIEFRLADLEEIATYFLPGLWEVKASLHEPSKASTGLDNMIREFNGLLERARKANEKVGQ